MNVDANAFNRQRRGLGVPTLGEVTVNWENVDAALNEQQSAPMSTEPPKKNFWDTMNNVFTVGNTALQTYQNRNTPTGSAAPPPAPEIPWMPIIIGGSVLLGTVLLVKSNK